MSNNIEKTLRDRYFFNEIFNIGDIVENIEDGEKVKIIDRGSNYVTVATASSIVKKWLDEIKECTEPAQEVTEAVVIAEKDFNITESGQIKLFGYETKNFDHDTSGFVIEQFEEFDDLYSKHQIIKCMDIALQENDMGYAYHLIEKVEGFYSKQNISVPFIIEALKNDTERTRLAEIIATVAGITPLKSNTATITAAIDAFKEKYKIKQQWEVIYPLLKLAYSMGIANALQNLPYTFATTTKEDFEFDLVVSIMEDHVDLIVDDLEIEDIVEAFEDDEFSDDVSEGLSIETRTKLGNKLKNREPVLTTKRERAMTRTASTSVLMDRARRLAETMLKRRMFHKSATDMSRQEKERFESGASKRKALVARLAQKLVGKVRMLQSARLHHAATPASTKHNDVATVVHGHSAGAS